MPNRWTDPFLDSMRLTGDPAADVVIQALSNAEQIEAVDRLLKDLIGNDQVPPDRLPPPIREFLEASSELPDWADQQKIREGQGLFERYGPMAVMLLFCKSLPLAYLAREGAQVLHLTARLSNDARRRVIETAQLIVDVMTPGGLDAQFREVLELGDRANDPDKRAEIREKYGITVVGPTLGEKLGLD